MHAAAAKRKKAIFVLLKIAPSRKNAGRNSAEPDKQTSVPIEAYNTSPMV
jgi:hypothetical protein